MAEEIKVTHCKKQRYDIWLVPKENLDVKA